MKANNGSGDNPSRDLWETKQELWDKLNQQYNFEFDCCASQTNKKTKEYSDDFEKVSFVEKTAWMNPPFSKARKMFEHFFKVVKKGVAIYRLTIQKQRYGKKLFSQMFHGFLFQIEE